jgi:hypothetical protein
MGNRVLGIREKAVRRAMELDRLQDYCRHIAKRLRGKTWTQVDTTPYSRQDLVREKYFALVALIRECFIPEDADKLLQCADQLYAQSREGEKRTIAAEFCERYAILTAAFARSIHPNANIEKRPCQTTKPPKKAKKRQSPSS